MSADQRLVLFFAFANESPQSPGYLRNLAEEARQVRSALDAAVYGKLCVLEVRYNVTPDEIFDVFARYRGRVAVFHYGGHADSFRLLLKDAAGNSRPAYADGLAHFLGQQPGVRLVFLNGCSTQGHMDQLLQNNVPAVVGTSREIRDDVATAFAARFYKGLASGSTIPAAFEQAVGAATTLVHAADVRALYYGGAPGPDSVLSGGFPWKLELPASAEAVANWTLPDAAEDPLFGMPSLPPLDYPDRPFRYLNRFGRNEARVFFGRGYEIREVYRKVTDPCEAPIVLLYGESGVGKSSLLEAGLLPRLEGEYEVRYLRRQHGGLRETLRLALLPDLTEQPPGGEGLAWLAREQRCGGKPAVVILDQVDEAFTRPGHGQMKELAELAELAERIFRDRRTRPRGKLVLGFRKEWFPELDRVFAERLLPRGRVFLQRLDRRGLLQAVQLSPDVREHYGMEMEPTLAEAIATELLDDPGSAVAPTLQVLLSVMYDAAWKQDPDNLRLTQQLHRQLKERGLHLGDFLDSQLAAIGRFLPMAIDSGLGLDVLVQHTTEMGTAGQCSETHLREIYRHCWADAEQLLDQCEDHYLLVRSVGAEARDGRQTRLAHDTLADLVRVRFEHSGKPGQRARRILDSRKRDWREEGKPGTPLDDADLRLVEAGQPGTRAWDEAERRLVVASQEQRSKRRRQRQRLIGAGLVAIMLIVTAGAVAEWQREQAAVQVKKTQEQIQKTQEQILENYRQLALTNWNSAMTARDLEQSPAKAILFLARAFQYASWGVNRDLAARAELAGGLLMRPVRLAGIVDVDKEFMMVASDKDGNRFLTWDDKGNVRVFTIDTNRALVEYKHAVEVILATWDQEGKRILSWDTDKNMRVWDVINNKAVTECKYPGELKLAPSWAPDGNRVAFWTNEGTVRIWSTTADQVVGEYKHPGEQVQVSWIMEGKSVASWSEDGTLLVWDALTQRITGQHRHPGLQAVSWNKARNRILSVALDNEMVRVCEIGDKPFAEYRHPAQVEGVSWDKEANRILSCSMDGTVMVWDIAAKRTTAEYKHPARVDSASWSPRQDQVLTSSSVDGTVRVWDVVNNRAVVKYQHAAGVWWSTWTQEAREVLTCDVAGTAKVWDVGTDKILAEFTGRAMLWEYRNPAARRPLSMHDDGTVRAWDINANRPLVEYEHPGEVVGASWDRAGQRVLSYGKDGTVRIWDVTLNSSVGEYKHPGDVWMASWSPHGDTALSFDGDGSVVVWDAVNNQALSMFKLSGGVQKASWDAGGQRVLFQSLDGTLSVWDIANKKIIAQFTDRRTKGAKLDEKGERILFWSDDTVRIRDLASNRILLEHKQLSDVQEAAWAKGGKWIFYWTQRGMMRVWDEDADQFVTDDKHLSWLSGAALDREEKRILYWGGDAVGVWDIAANKSIREKNSQNSLLGASWNPKGNWILSWDDEAVQVWDVIANKVVANHKSEVSIHSASWDQEGRRVLFWDLGGGLFKSAGAVWVWEVSGNRTLTTYQHPNGMGGASWAKGDKRILSWGGGDTLKVQDVEANKLVVEDKFLDGISEAAWDPAGDRVLAWSLRRKVRVLDLRGKPWDSLPPGTSAVELTRGIEAEIGARLDEANRPVLLSRQEWIDRKR